MCVECTVYILYQFFLENMLFLPDSWRRRMSRWKFVSKVCGDTIVKFDLITEYDRTFSYLLFSLSYVLLTFFIFILVLSAETNPLLLSRASTWSRAPVWIKVKSLTRIVFHRPLLLYCVYLSYLEKLTPVSASGNWMEL